MPAPSRPVRVATLWKLACDENCVACVVYQSESGLQLRLESGAATILTEPFELQPRMLARSRALRNSLLRRGWQEPLV